MFLANGGSQCSVSSMWFTLYCTISIGSATPCDRDMFDRFGTSAAALGHCDTKKISAYQVIVCMISVRFQYSIQAARDHKSK